MSKRSIIFIETAQKLVIFVVIGLVFVVVSFDRVSKYL
jgi:hypothetical protein